MTPDGFPTVGIVGAGQLARMMVQAAVPLGIAVRVLAERADDGAARVCPDVTIGRADDPEALRAFAAGCDVVTLDHELVDLGALEAIAASGVPVRPGATALAFAKDKLHQRTRFAAAGLPVPDFEALEPGAGGAAVLLAFAERHGWPVVAKAQRGGYDGRGVWVLDSPDAARALAEECAAAGVALLVEQFVPIQKELAVLVVRRPAGEMAVYPVVETVQRDGICREVLAPAPVPPEVAAEARAIGERVAVLIEATGVVATELFWAVDGRILINEVATRPHNSGHFSIEGARTSQFENHLRAVLDWPLGPVELVAPVVVMANLLGTGSESIAARVPATLDIDPGVHPYFYGKQVRLGRKIGHVNALGERLDETRERAVRAAALLVGAAPTE
jgi:5-(carboxyamino)imidazole ribonucleotide synthase